MKIKLVLSCRVSSCRVASSLVVSCRVKSRPVRSRLVTSRRVLSRLVLSCRVTSRRVQSGRVAQKTAALARDLAGSEAQKRRRLSLLGNPQGLDLDSYTTSRKKDQVEITLRPQFRRLQRQLQGQAPFHSDNGRRSGTAAADACPCFACAMCSIRKTPRGRTPGRS